MTRSSGGTGADVIEGGAGNDVMWGGNWAGDGAGDRFVLSSGSGEDFIFDFETGHDTVDLASYGIDFSDVQAQMVDHGWATQIKLSGLEGGQAGDNLYLVGAKVNDLGEENFAL